MWKEPQNLPIEVGAVVGIPRKAIFVFLNKAYLIGTFTEILSDRVSHLIFEAD
jgi:hypothetical protein